MRENLDAELLEQPITATWLGVHAWDDRVDDVRPEAQAREATRLRALLERLRADRRQELDAAHAFDRLLLEHRADAALYTLTELRPLERNPLVYCDLAQSAIYELVTDDFLPPTERAARRSTRGCGSCARLLDDARRNLRATAPELAVRRAIDEAQSAKGFIAETLPQGDAGRARAQAARRAAQRLGRRRARARRLRRLAARATCCRARTATSRSGAIG